MEFSIIVPVYNVERYLNECINSLKAQTYKDFEVILVDDGSTDNSGLVCDKVASENAKFKVIHKKNGGLISARRSGLKKVCGEYILFCDSDDLLRENALEVLYGIINSSHADVVSFNATVFNEYGEKIFSEPVFDDGIIDKSMYIDKIFDSYALNSMCMKAIKKTIIDIDRDYQEFYTCNFGEDLLQSMPVVLKAKTIYYTSRSLYLYRMDSGMMRKYSSNYYWSYRRVNREILAQLENAGIDDARDKASVHLLKATYGALIQGQFAAKYPREDWKRIREDDVFVKNYKSYKECQSKIMLRRKERAVLALFNYRLTWILYVALKVRNRIRR